MTLSPIQAKKEAVKALLKVGIDLQYFDDSEIRILKQGLMLGMAGKGKEILDLLEIVKGDKNEQG